ncbi:hypothetical protein B2J88_51535 [Rhodococcus sp. SRB_17]|nr:hypothetical protein [Rhodococcus sp. SRB_17]
MMRIFDANESGNVSRISAPEMADSETGSTATNRHRSSYIKASVRYVSFSWLLSVTAPHPCGICRKGNYTMATPDLRRRPDRTHRTRAAGAFGAAVLAAATIATVGTGTAAAAAPAEILTAACTHYEPDPVWNPGNPALNRVSDCHGAYLFGADLAGANLAGANLNSANLFIASLNGANLTGANLTGATLTYANLNDANLNDANLNSAKLNSAKLNSAKLNRAKLTYANLNSANLNDANLNDANLNGATLNDATLYRADLTKANLSWTTLYGANLTGANLNGATLNGANLNGATLNDTDLTSANLTGSSVIPGNVSAPATSVDGATATWTAPTLPIGVTVNSCDHTSGTQFPIGPTLVTCTVGNDRAGTGTFTVTVTTQAPLFADTTPVALTGTVGTVLTRTFTATGTPNPTVTVVDPTQLPPGMTFANDPVTGVPTLSGTPTAAGSYTFTLTADNGVGTPKTLDVTMTVAPTPVAPVFADTTPVALTGTVGTVLTRTFTATGTPNPTVTVVDPTQLPPGMTFANDPVTGVPTLSGTPTAAGSYTFTLTADNGVGAPVSLTTTVTVEAPATGSLGSLFGS